MKQPVERPQQVVANHGHIGWKAFELLGSFSEAFNISWFYLAKYFWSLLNCSNLITQQCKHEQCKWHSLIFLVSWKYREIMTVKTISLYKKLTFFMKSLKNKKKKNLALTSSRNMVGQFRKTYLHRPIKILHFLTPARIQKCLI